MRVLIVEDDERLIQSLRLLLEKENYIVDSTDKVSHAVYMIENVAYDAVLLDRCLHNEDGLSVIEKVKKSSTVSRIPYFLVLSAIYEPQERVNGLSAGAVDYIGKPYEPKELLLRLKNWSSRNQGQVDTYIQYGNIVCNLDQHSISVNDKTLVLRRKEYLILKILMQKKGKVISHDHLEEKIYNFDEEIGSNSISSQICRIRSILRKQNANVSINVVRNIGYFLKAAEE